MHYYYAITIPTIHFATMHFRERIKIYLKNEKTSLLNVEQTLLLCVVEHHFF